MDYSDSETADYCDYNHARESTVSFRQQREQTYTSTQNQAEMEKERPAAVCAKMTRERLNAVARQVDGDQQKAAPRQAQREFTADRRKNRRGHTREHVDQKMDRRKRQQLRPVKCRDFFSQVSPGRCLELLTRQLLEGLDVFFAGFRPDVLG